MKQNLLAAAGPLRPLLIAVAVFGLACCVSCASATASPSPAWSLNLPDPTAEWSNTLAWNTSSAPDGEVTASFSGAACAGSTTIVDGAGAPTATVAGLGSIWPTGEPDRWVRVVGSAFDESCSRGAIELIDSNGRVIWSYEMSLNELPDDVVLGGSGVIYLTYRQFFGNVEYMVGLDRATGAVRFNKSLPELGMPNKLSFAVNKGNAAEGEALAATPEGAVAVSAGAFAYINGSGEVLHTGSYPYGVDPLVAVNTAGEVLTTYSIPNTGITEAIEHEPAQGYGTLIASDGSIRWSHALTLPGNYYSRPVLAAAPNDAWVFIDEYNDALDSVLPTVIAIRGADGTQMWATRLLPMEHNSSLSLVGVDTTEHVYAYGREQEPCTENCEPECSYTCTFRRVVIALSTETGAYDERIEVAPASFLRSNAPFSLGGGKLAMVAVPIERIAEEFLPARLQSYTLPHGGAMYPPPPESALETGSAGSSGGGSSGASSTLVSSRSSGVVSSSGSTQSAHLCGSQRGSLAARFIGSLRCSVSEFFSANGPAACGIDMVKLIAPGLRAIKYAKAADGLIDLRKVKKAYRPLAQLYNTIMRFKLPKGLPPGFRTGAQLWQTVKHAKNVEDALKIVGVLANDIPADSASSADLMRVAGYLTDIAGVKSCVVGLLSQGSS